MYVGRVSGVGANSSSTARLETLTAATCTPQSTKTAPNTASEGATSASAFAATVAATPAMMTSRWPAWSATQPSVALPAIWPPSRSAVKRPTCDAGGSHTRNAYTV